MILFNNLVKVFFLNVILLFCLSSCVKEEENNNDFRDQYIGIYNCTVTFYYFNPIDDTIMNWSTDTILINHEVFVEKITDSSLIVILNESNSFEALYEGNNKFTCTECNGPNNYIRFFGTDSMYVYEKYGVTNSRNYYGKKMVL